MPTGAVTASTFTFGDFQLDCRALELKKRGRKLRVPQQSVQILCLLIAAAGEVVTREELRGAVWGQDTHVDFDRGINKAINRLRQVLGDASERPRFIETVPKRGYRFLVPVTSVSTVARVTSPEVRESLLKAKHFSSKRTMQDLLRSVEYFRQAIERDPECAEAWAGLAEVYWVMGGFGLKPPDEAFPAARLAAERALALNGALAQGHTVLAGVKKFHEFDWVGAERAYRRAIKVDPQHSLAHREYAQLLSMLARHKEALAEIEAARQCDPVSAPVNAFVAHTYLEARQYDRAVVAGLKAVEIESAAPLPYFSLGRAYAKTGKFQLAIDAFTETLRLAGNVPIFAAYCGYTYARAGQRAKAEAILNEFNRGQLTPFVSPIHRALVLLGLDDIDAALAGLEDAYAARAPWMVSAGDPFFSELASEPRYRQLMGRLRLPVQA